MEPGQRVYDGILEKGEGRRRTRKRTKPMGMSFSLRNPKVVRIWVTIMSLRIFLRVLLYHSSLSEQMGEPDAREKCG